MYIYTIKANIQIKSKKNVHDKIHVQTNSESVNASLGSRPILIQTEMAPFDPPSPKTPHYRTKHEVDGMTCC